MAKKIRDTIHGYIYLTKLEEAISQHQLVLRMHHIHQTSFTYLTYPNAHSTRYPHSLGVMHVAGDIFLSAISSTPRPVLVRLAGLVSMFLDTNYPGRHTAIAQQIAQMQEGERTEPLYRLPLSAGLAKDDEHYAQIVLLFQAVRLAALLHDVGHPPFSHIVEYGLLQARGDEYLGHEEVGAELLREIQDDKGLEKRKGFSRSLDFSHAALGLCREILHGGSGSNFWGIERSLLSGPIDADRLDYVRRDAYAAGLVPSYDIRRMVDAAFFRTSEQGKLEIGYRPNCLSSIENFFFARYDLYRYMIYHHDVVRRNLSIQRLLAIILDPSAAVDAKVRAVGAKMVSCATGKAQGGFGFYARFVDAYFLNLLWEIDDLLTDSDQSLDEPVGQLRLYLDLVLRRRNDKLQTLLKRPDHYAGFAKDVLEGEELQTLLKRPDHYAGFEKDVPEGGERLELPKKPVPQLNHLLRAKLESIKKSKGVKENVAKLELAHQVEAHMNKAAKKTSSNGRFYCYYLGTFSAGPRREVKFSEPGSDAAPVLAEDVSPTIAMLEEAWNFSPQLLVFFHMPQGGAPVEDSDKPAILRPSAVAGLQAFLATP